MPIHGVGYGARLAKAPQVVSHHGVPETSGDVFSGEALKTRSKAAGGAQVLWLGGATHLANSQGLGMAAR